MVLKLEEALRDPEWHMLRVNDDRGEPVDITRQEATELLESLMPAEEVPPNVAIH